MEDYIVLTAHIFPDKQQKAEILKADYDLFIKVISEMCTHIMVNKSDEELKEICEKLEINPALKIVDFALGGFFRVKHSFDSKKGKKLSQVFKLISEILNVNDYDFAPVKWHRYITLICLALDFKYGFFKPVFYFTEERREIPVRIL